jgi:hypothetical protein
VSESFFLQPLFFFLLIYFLETLKSGSGSCVKKMRGGNWKNTRGKKISVLGLFKNGKTCLRSLSRKLYASSALLFPSLLPLYLPLPALVLPLGSSSKGDRFIF